MSNTNCYANIDEAINDLDLYVITEPKKISNVNRLVYIGSITSVSDYQRTWLKENKEKIIEELDRRKAEWRANHFLSNEDIVNPFLTYCETDSQWGIKHLKKNSVGIFAVNAKAYAFDFLFGNRLINIQKISSSNFGYPLTNHTIAWPISKKQQIEIIEEHAFAMHEIFYSHSNQWPKDLDTDPVIKEIIKETKENCIKEQVPYIRTTENGFLLKNYPNGDQSYVAFSGVKFSVELPICNGRDPSLLYIQERTITNV